MPNLTLQEVFGTGVTFNDTTRSITFNLNGLNDGTIDPVIEDYLIDSTNLENNVGRILWAMVNRLIKLQPSDNIDNERSIYVTNQGKRIVTRNNVSQFAFQLVLNGYANDPFGVEASSADLVPGIPETSAQQDGAGGS